MIKRLCPALLVLLFCSGCSYIFSSSKDPVMFSAQEEIDLGRQVKAEVEKEYHLYPNAGLSAYVVRIGARLAAVSDRKELPYSFAVVDSKEVNAFALPGGPVYITTALLRLLDDEAELAAVLGHEIGHIELRHSMKQLQRSQMSGCFLGLVFALFLPEQKDLGQALGRNAAQLATALVMLKNSREAELEADELGLKLAAKVGYAPQGMLGVQDKLKRLRSTEPSAVEVMLSTHPPSQERLDRARVIINAMPAAAYQTNRESYVRETSVLRGK